MIDIIFYDFQPFACIMTERFDNTSKDQSNYISGKRITKNVEKRLHKIKQTKLLTSFQRDNQSR